MPGLEVGTDLCVLGSPDRLSDTDVPGDTHQAALLQSDIAVHVCFDGGTLLGHDLGLHVRDLHHRHGLRQRAGKENMHIHLLESLTVIIILRKVTLFYLNMQK